MSFNAWLEGFVTRMQEQGVASEDALEGCTSEEIARIEEDFRVRLPDKYRQMLMRFGKVAGSLSDTSEMDFYYPAIVALNNRLREGNSELTIPQGAFAIRGRYDQDVEFVIDSEKSTVEAVWYVGEGSNNPVPFYPSLEDWLDVLLADASQSH